MLITTRLTLALWPLALALSLPLVGCSEPPSPSPEITTPVVEEPAPNSAAAPADERFGPAFEAIARGDFTTSTRLARAVLVDHPGHPRATFMLALSMHKQKRYAEALPLFNSAEFASSSYAGQQSVPYYLGWCHYWLGNFDQARAAFERRLAIADEGDSHFGLGVIELEIGNPPAARKNLNRALAMFEQRVVSGDLLAKRDLAKTHARLADVDMAIDDDDAARVHLDMAVDLDPERAAIWFKLYNLCLAAGDSERAAEAKAEYERRSPGGSQ